MFMAKDKPKITVVGSCNMDLVVRSARIPVVGETIMGSDFMTNPGGKGANQAVAAAKLGADVHFVGRLGNDAFGKEGLANMQSVGINTDHVSMTKGVSSGVALITVDDKGNNAIVVAPGANDKVTPADVKKAASVIKSSGALVVQLEVPMETVKAAVKIAHDAKILVVFDPAPAPAKPLDADLIKMIDILKPNEIEAEMLSGIKVKDETSAKAAAQKLLDKGVKSVILTLGEKGCLVAADGKMEFIAAKKVKAVDSTAAGDAFTGALAVGLTEGKSLTESVNLASHVAALSVTKRGAQASMPTRKEVTAFMK
jgi:ribokinase